MANADPLFNINWDEVDESGGPVAEEDYTLKARKAEIVPTKDGNGVNVKVMWTHEEPDFRGNMPITDYFTFRPLTGVSGEQLDKNKKVMGMTKGKIRRVFGEVPGGFGPNDVAQAILGRVVRAHVIVEDYTNKEGKASKSNKIARYLDS